MDPPPSNSDYKESITESTIILGLYRDSIGIMEKKMETTVVYGLGGPPHPVIVIIRKV